MDAQDFLTKNFTVGEEAIVSGWLSVLDGEPVLFSENLNHDIKLITKLYLDDRDIVFAALVQVELVAGGHCMLFHPIKLNLKVLNINPIKIKLLEVLIDARDGNDYRDLILSTDMVDKGKKIYPDFFTKKVLSGDWLNS
jgi:hypothetical protein